MTRKVDVMRKSKTNLLKKIIGFALIGVLSYVVGYFLGQAGAKGVRFDLDWDKLTAWFYTGGHIILLLSFLTVLYLFFKSLRMFKAYQSQDLDDDVMDDLDRRLNLEIDYLQIANSTAAVTSLFLMMNGFQMTPEELKFPIFAFLGLIVSGIFQMIILWFYGKIRGIKVSLLPSVKELKNNILEQDEAELQANYKMAFEVVMTLSSAILPGCYFLLFIISTLTGQSQLVAFLIVTIIHFYILFANLKMARKFYR